MLFQHSNFLLVGKGQPVPAVVVAGRRRPHVIQPHNAPEGRLLNLKEKNRNHRMDGQTDVWNDGRTKTGLKYNPSDYSTRWAKNEFGTVTMRMTAGVLCVCSFCIPHHVEQGQIHQGRSLGMLLNTGASGK